MNLQLTGFEVPEGSSVVVPDLRAYKVNAVSVLREIVRNHFDADMETLRVWGVDRALEDGAAHKHVSERQTIDITHQQAQTLAWFIDEDRKQPMELHRALGTYEARVRDQRNDSIDGPAFKDVNVRYDEHLTAHVLSVKWHDTWAEALIEVTGEGGWNV